MRLFSTFEIEKIDVGIWFIADQNGTVLFFGSFATSILTRRYSFSVYSANSFPIFSGSENTFKHLYIFSR